MTYSSRQPARSAAPAPQPSPLRPDSALRGSTRGHAAHSARPRREGAAIEFAAAARTRRPPSFATRGEGAAGATCALGAR